MKLRRSGNPASEQRNRRRISVIFPFAAAIYGASTGVIVPAELHSPDFHEEIKKVPGQNEPLPKGSPFCIRDLLFIKHISGRAYIARFVIHLPERNLQ